MKAKPKVRAKPKKNKETVGWSTTATIVIAGLTLVFGTILGHWWSYKQSKISQASYELDKTSKVMAIRDNIYLNTKKLLDLHKKHSDIANELNKNYSEENRERASREIESIWKYEYPVVMDSIKESELALSKLENKELKKFDRPLHPPYNLRMITKD